MNDITILSPAEKASVTFSLENGIVDQHEVTDSLKELAKDVGIVDSINEMNQESYETDQELRDQHFNGPDNDAEQDHYEEHYEENAHNEPVRERKKPHKKHKIDKRINDLTYRLAIKDDEIKRLQQEHEANLLAIKLSIDKQKIDSDIDRISDIMVMAKDENDTQSYVQANKLLNKLIKNQDDTESALQHLNDTYSQHSQETNQNNEYLQMAEEKFLELSDTKEINSPHYAEWLQKHQYFNPYDAENFDNDLASEIAGLKKNFNKFLKLKRNAHYIGTPQYYNDLDSMIEQNFGGANNNYNDYQENDDMSTKYTVHVDPNYERNLPGHHNSDKPRVHYSEPKSDSYYEQQKYAQRRVAPVNRSGYQNQSSQQLPQLSPIELQIARSFTSMAHPDGTPMSEDERIMEYRVQKAQGNR